MLNVLQVSVEDVPRLARADLDLQKNKKKMPRQRKVEIRFVSEFPTHPSRTL